MKSNERKKERKKERKMRKMRKSSNERPARKKTNIILRTLRNLTRSGEDYGKQKQKIIWTRRGSRKLGKVWERKWARRKL